MKTYTFQFWLVAVAGWTNRQQQDVFACLQGENHACWEMPGPNRLRFSDEQRRRLAAKTKMLAGKVLDALDSIVRPATLLRWYRELIVRE